MGNTNTKKNSAGKGLLSVLFFVLILLSSLLLALCMDIRTKGGTVLTAYGDVFGEGFTKFLSGSFCFWLAFSAVVLWFGLWIVSVKKIPSAIRGLGIACSISALVVLVGELLNLLITCVFKADNAFAGCASSLPSQFGDGCGDNVLFLLWSIIVASVGIFICKLKKLPKKTDSSGCECCEEKKSASGVCPSCGHKNPNGVSFCGKCGHKIN